MTHPVKSPKKLIEVALPLDKINAAAAREKSIRHGHPSTLHLWWARRPLAAARAVLFAQLVNDPGYERHLQRGVNKEQAALERERLFKIIEELVKWENTNNEEVLEEARAEIWKSWRETCKLNRDHPQAAELFNPEKLPAFHDPFAGGGAIPLEAQRLGLEAYASDLNPVAVLINKAMIEIPPRFAGRPPVSLGARASRSHKGWHSRGYLPHCDTPGHLQSITFRLHDSLPADVLERLAQEADSPEKRERVEALMDAGHGACWLRQPRIAALVENALLHFDGERYRLLAWCVMPNHVHALIETREGHPLGDILHGWKSFTAKQINRALGRTGKVWMEDYYDRYIRDEKHLAAVVEYIEQNPVKAGLAKRPDEWAYGSAAHAGEGKKASETLALPGTEEWPGAKGLAEDVRHYGQWMRDEAEKRIGHLYPKVEVTAEMAAGNAGVSPARPDLKPYVGKQLTVIAWLWARTVKSPNPAFSHVDVPLASSFILSSKKGKEAWVQPVVEGDTYRFDVRVGAPPPEAKNGTKLARGANFRCIMSNTPINDKYIKAESMGGRMGTRLMAIVAEGARGRVYLAPASEQEAIARRAEPKWRPDQPMNRDTRDLVSGRGYGFFTWADLFTPRQLVALTTFSDLVQEAIEKARQDALAAGGFSHIDTEHSENDSGSAHSVAPWQMEDGGSHRDTEHSENISGSAHSVAPWQMEDGGSHRDTEHSENISGSVHSVAPWQEEDGGSHRGTEHSENESGSVHSVAPWQVYDDRGLEEGGTGATAYAQAVGVYLAFGMSRASDAWSSVVTWRNSVEASRSTFARQALPMTWDFTEVNPFSDSCGNWTGNSVDWVYKSLVHLPQAAIAGMAAQAEAQTQTLSTSRVVSTDPPYYDNIGYADLSDFFYVWLRRALLSWFSGNWTMGVSRLALFCALRA